MTRFRTDFDLQSERRFFDRMNQGPVRTPDGRYIVHIGRQGPRLWRASNPNLSPGQLQELTDQLMDARRSVKEAADDADRIASARRRVDEAKNALGERGDVWWTDGAPDFNRMLIKNTPYYEWWKNISTRP